MLELHIELDGRVISLARVDRDLIIGRSTSADVCVDSTSVSRQHCIRQ